MKRVAIVGLGQIGMTYDLSLSDKYCLSYCRAFSKHNSFSICAGVDVDRNKREIFESNFNATFYDSVETAMIETKPSVLVVSVDTQSHLSVIESALMANGGLKYILCEKPFGGNSAEASKIVELSERFGVKTFVNYMRYSVQRLRDDLSEFLQKSSGCPINGTVTYTGSLIHSGSHFLQLLLSTIVQNSIQFEAVSEKINVLSGRNINIIFINSGVNSEDRNQSLYEVDLMSSKGRLKLIRGGREVGIFPVVEDEVFSNNRTFGEPLLLRGIMDNFQFEVVSELDNAIKGSPYHLCTEYMGLQIHKMCESKLT